MKRSPVHARQPTGRCRIKTINVLVLRLHTRKRSTNKFIINANNGCLGDFDRGRTQTAAILVGEVPSTFDPAVSEWSNPPIFGKPLVKLVP